jgi:hypothetical protein
MQKMKKHEFSRFRKQENWQHNEGQENKLPSPFFCSSFIRQNPGMGGGVVAMREHQGFAVLGGASVDGDSAALSRRQRDAAGNTVLPESRCGFDSQGAGGELLMRRECPEMGRGKG